MSLSSYWIHKIILEMLRLVHNLSYYVLQALLDVRYEVARSCFHDLVLFEVMKVAYIQRFQRLIYSFCAEPSGIHAYCVE